MLLSYISTLRSLKQTWIEVALSSGDYEKMYMFDAQNYAHELKDADLNCMSAISPDDGSNGENYANQMRAEGLYWYARVIRTNALIHHEPDKKTRIRQMTRDLLVRTRRLMHNFQGIALD